MTRKGAMWYGRAMLYFNLAACLMPMVALAAMQGTAHAQAPRPSGDDNRGTSLSLQSQLGSIPLVSPRAGAKAAMERVVRITQVAGREVVGDTRVISCPDTGCQQVISLVVDRVAQSFLMDIQFVRHGAYVALQSRSAAIGGVMDFGQGKPGPVFIRGTENATTEHLLSFVTAAATSLRRLETGPDGKTLASGNVYNRKQSPDFVLKLVIERAKEK